jgi:hypothetical protein
MIAYDRFYLERPTKLKPHMHNVLMPYLTIFEKSKTHWDKQLSKNSNTEKI